MPRPHDSPQGDRRRVTRCACVRGHEAPQVARCPQAPGARCAPRCHSMRLACGHRGPLEVRDLRGAWCARKPCAKRCAVAHEYAPMILETLHPVEIPHVSCVLSFHRTRSFHDKPLRLPKYRAPRAPPTAAKCAGGPQGQNRNVPGDHRANRYAPGSHRAKTLLVFGGHEATEQGGQGHEATGHGGRGQRATGHGPRGQSCRAGAGPMAARRGEPESRESGVGTDVDAHLK